MGSIPVGDSDISLSHTRVMLNNSSLTFHDRAQNSPSLFTVQVKFCGYVFANNRDDIV